MAKVVEGGVWKEEGEGAAISLHCRPKTRPGKKATSITLAKKTAAPSKTRKNTSFLAAKLRNPSAMTTILKAVRRTRRKVAAEKPAFTKKH